MQPARNGHAGENTAPRKWWAVMAGWYRLPAVFGGPEFRLGPGREESGEAARELIVRSSRAAAPDPRGLVGVFRNDAGLGRVEDEIIEWYAHWSARDPASRPPAEVDLTGRVVRYRRASGD